MAQGVVVVTGAREPLPAQRLVGDVVVIDAERIRASAGDSLEDLLRREAGLQLSRNGGPGASTGLFIRGASSASTLVLVDGVRIGAATTGQAEFEGLSLSQIERIEVLRGPASSLYGADAVGGVVQIFTLRGQAEPRVALAAAIGQLGAREGSASADARVGRFDLAASLSADRNQGVSALRPGDLFGNFYADRDGYTRRGAQAQVGYSPADGQRIGLQAMSSRLNAQYDGSEFLPPTFAQDNSADFRNRLAMRSAALEYRAQWSAGLVTLLRATRQASDLESGGRALDRFRTERSQWEAQATWNATPGQQWTLAAEQLRERSESTSFLADVARDNDAVVAAYAGRWGAVDLQVEARHDDNSIWGGVRTGRAAAAWEVASGWRLRAVAGTTFRAPSFNDLYFPGFGVPTVQPERGRSLELGLNWSGREGDAALTTYRNRVRDLIGYEPDRSFCPAGVEYDFGCARNIGRARLQGATLAAGWRAGPWSWRGTADFLDAKDQATGARLTRRAAHQETVAIDYRGHGWSMGAELLRVGARPEAGDVLAAYTTVDLKARWLLSPTWSINARLLNATDRDHEPALDYRPLGRQAWLGLRYEAKGL